MAITNAEKPHDNKQVLVSATPLLRGRRDTWPWHPEQAPQAKT
eukprot:CAMPEP_0203908438 /NCGR_PEP_ID=MMETSP0359-20131031/49840_1 /ASSEMBLY_ACC=CAM_ASM_000338 /TAXON_ID=268821 /ORGANISM="Scrippsiella Hangoei, Strain SHTV-5" /LENGTH=42 /DNA_ID= /DNA_START= /DNA_END= /DNA_ORIENTATION=